MIFKRPFWLGLSASLVMTLAGYVGIILTDKSKVTLEDWIGVPSALAAALGGLGFICLVVWAFIMIVISRIHLRQSKRADQK